MSVHRNSCSVVFKMRLALVLLVILVDIASCLIRPIDLLPYQAIHPARSLLLIWNNWYKDDYASFGRQGQLLEGDKCDVTEAATLQWAYFRTLNAPTFTTNEDKLYPSIQHIATHFDFYKEKMYPFLPRTSRYGFCEYSKGGSNNLVCDNTQKRCVKCSAVAVAVENVVLREACNPQPAEEEVYRPVENGPGLAIYKEMKKWVRLATQTWRKKVGDPCTAHGSQVLALATLRSFLTPGMRNGRAARSKTEWVRERKWIREKFGDDESLQVLHARSVLRNSGVRDEEATYCSPLGGDGQIFVTNRQNKLICGEHGICETCLTQSGSFRVSGNLEEACRLMGLEEIF